MKPSLLYIGNDLTAKSQYQSTMATLSALLGQEGYKVIRTSSKQNKILRLLDMLFQLFKNRNQANYILIDTFSTSNFYYALATSQLARILHKKYIPILHGGNLPERLDRNPLLSRMIFQHAYANVAPSGYLQYEFGQRGYHTTYIPNVLPIEDYSFKVRKDLKPRILWVRAFARLYNPAMAIYVLEALKKSYPDAKLCMVGPDKGDGSLQETHKLVKALGLKDRVLFTGVLPKEEWHELSENYDIFINTTTIDNTPVSVMEAMALGLPVVSTRVGGLPYLIEDGEDGLLVASNHVTAMTEAIQKLLTDTDLVTKITSNARKKVEGFDWSVVREKWNELLE